MSTGCQIGFYDDPPSPATLAKPDALIYRHHDGYPDTEYGVLATLAPLLADYTTRRGFWDAEHCAAFVIAQWLAPDSYGLGHGVSQDLHGDIAYFYAVSAHRIQVYEPVGDPDYATMTCVEEVPW